MTLRSFITALLILCCIEVCAATEHSLPAIYTTTTDLNFRTASNKQFLVELALIRLCQLLSPSTTAMTSGGR